MLFCPPFSRCANTYPTLGPIAQCRVSLPPVRGVPKGRRDDYAMEEEMTVPGEKAVPVGLRPATHLEMRCVLGESNDPVGGRAGSAGEPTGSLAGGSS